MRRLVQKARRGDEDAFGELVKTYHQRVFGVVYGMLNNAEDAQEVTQQAWIKAWNKLESFKADAGFFTWMYRIATNTCLDFLRKRARTREEAMPDRFELPADAQLESAPSLASRPDREAQQDEIREAFEAALEELSPEHRMAITLREVEGLSYAEIAKAMGCSKGTVMSRIFYARRKLQERLKGLT